MKDFASLQTSIRDSSDTRASILTLYRHLLRETTYLAHAPARSWAWDHIRSRFRDNQAKEKALGPDRQRKLVFEASRALKHLKYANAGQLAQLQKVLLQTYGRVGKRRHELLSPLRETEESDLSPRLNETLQRNLRDSSRSRKYSEHAFKTNKHGIMEPYLPSKLKRLVESQVAARPPDYARAQLPDTLFRSEFPDKNVWGRSIPEKRKKNLIKRWYGSLVDRALPPLPQEEWDKLKALVLGLSEVGNPITRRPGNWGTDKEDKDIPSGLEGALKRKKLPPPKDAPHCITPRFMRRVLARVFSTSCVMNWDEQKQTWNFTWGHQVLQRSIETAQNYEGSLFEGVDHAGTPMRKEPPSPGGRLGKSERQMSQQIFPKTANIF